MLSVHIMVVLDLNNTKHPLWFMLVNQNLRSVEPFVCVLILRMSQHYFPTKLAGTEFTDVHVGKGNISAVAPYSTSAVDWFRTTETQESKTHCVVSNPRASIDCAVSLVNKIVVVICPAKPRLSKRALGTHLLGLQTTHKYIT